MACIGEVFLNWHRFHTNPSSRFTNFPRSSPKSNTPKAKIETDDRMVRVASSHSCAAEVVGSNTAISAPATREAELDTAEGCPGMLRFHHNG